MIDPDDDTVADFELDQECDFCGMYGLDCECKPEDFEEPK